MGLDLLDFFRGRYSWRKLATLIRQLPSSSRTTEAMANDDELAEAYVDKPAQDSGPRLSEYTAEVARLDAVVDRLGELIGVIHQLASGKSLRMKPARRPETAFSRAAKRRTDNKMLSLMAEVEEAQKRAAG